MTMFNVVKKEIDWDGQKLSIETGKVARQAAGSVLVTMGETVVHVAVSAAKEEKEGQDFFPLTVNYQEKTYSAGKIPGGFFKREGRPSEKETLTSRLIDRPIRPLFPSNFKNEVQVVCTLISYDGTNEPETLAMIGASAALTLSGVPFMGPIAGAKVGYINEEFVLNPTNAQMEESKLNLSVAGTTEGVLMVESEAHELSEKVMLDAVMFGFEKFQPVISMIKELEKEAGKEKWEAPAQPKEFDEVYTAFEKLIGADLDDAFKTTEKMARGKKVAAAWEKALASLGEETEENAMAHKVAASVFKKLESNIVRSAVIKTGVRIDGRDTKTVRAIECEVGVLPKVHGSGLFTRGETQALVVTTLGTGQDEQVIDAIAGEYKEPFMLHYNFPPYSVGECGRVGAPGRREIGHGKLAWRAIHPMLPSADKFPYTIRAVSEIMESNGSSSMATVCGTSLSLMDAGVPLTKPVAGIAMGLIKEESGEFQVLSDILGDEDHLGDMDFKVAGTKDGITALQMDIKITSITKEIMEIALAQANEGRNTILENMNSVISEGRSTVSENAPRITTIKINPDKIREVIGTGGKVIREITEKTGCKIDISDDGIISVAAVNAEDGQKALDWIHGIVAEPEVGHIYEGKVVKIMDFGAFVNFMGRDGLVHISELSNERAEKVTDYLNEGDKAFVKVLGVDNRGKIKLTIKNINQETGIQQDYQKFEDS